MYRIKVYYYFDSSIHLIIHSLLFLHQILVILIIIIIIIIMMINDNDNPFLFYLNSITCKETKNKSIESINQIKSNLSNFNNNN